MIAALCLLTALMHGQEESFVYRAGISLVRVDAQVTQGDRVLSKLNKEDFVIFDNDVPQTILHFAEENEPLDLILVLDTSSSMHKTIKSVSRAAHEALKHLRTGDRVAVTQFALHIHVAQPLTENFRLVESAIEKICSKPFRGGTNIYGAFDNAADLFMKEPRTSRRRAVLMITDGVGPSFLPRKTVLRKLWESDTVANGLIVKGSNPGLSRMKINVANVPDIAEQTGGEALKVQGAGEGFRQIMERIRRRYSLHYAPPQGKEGEIRTVRVELSAAARKRFSSARVRARKGYIWRIAAHHTEP